MRALLLLLPVVLALSACGPKAERTETKAPAAKTGVALPTGPVLSGVGVISAIEGTQITLDHEAVTGGLPAGRNVFRIDAAALAEAPIEPGARVAFSYQDWKPAPLITELKAR
jgi:hypothetical protein